MKEESELSAYMTIFTSQLEKLMSWARVVIFAAFLLGGFVVKLELGAQYQKEETKILSSSVKELALISSENEKWRVGLEKSRFTNIDGDRLKEEIAQLESRVQRLEDALIFKDENFETILKTLGNIEDTLRGK